jgi:hypothetical protein
MIPSPPKATHRTKPFQGHGIGRGMDGASPLLVADKIGQEDRMHDAARLAEGCLEFAFMAAGFELAQDR